jgi:hypothetical protein
MKATSLRSSAPEVRNPLLRLRSAEALTKLPDTDGRALRALLDGVRREARAVGDALWQRGRRRQAAYWRASSVYAFHAARLAYPRPASRAAGGATQGTWSEELRCPNPLLGLPAANTLGALPDAASCALENLLMELRQDAQACSSKSWSTSKSPLASYWAEVSTFAGHCARHLRRARQAQGAGVETVCG